MGTTLDYEYDEAGRLEFVKRGATTIESYAFDLNGNRTSWTNGYGSFTATYDAQDRLLQVQPQAGSAITYTYTRGGELRTKTQNGQTVTTTYDVLGNLIQAQLPDGIAIEYVHDGRSRRIAKKVNGAIVKGWIYSTGSLPIAETDATGVITTRFVYGLRRVPEYFVRDGSKYRIYTEPNGSVRFVVQSTTGGIAQQINYDSFGNVTFDSNPGFQPFGYGGGLYDPQTGLVRFGARDYDPYVGRWTAKDPIGFAGGETAFYTYVGNDPVNGVDPSGLGETLDERDPNFGLVDWFYLRGLFHSKAWSFLEGLSVEAGLTKPQTVPYWLGFAAGVFIDPSPASESKLVTKLFHGTSLDVATRFLRGEGLDAAAAAAAKIDGPQGFFLATSSDAAEYFAQRRVTGGSDGAVIAYELSQRAVSELEGAGARLQPIPFGKAYLPGQEFFVPPGAFDLFNRLRSEGEIVINGGL